MACNPIGWMYMFPYTYIPLTHYIPEFCVMIAGEVDFKIKQTQLKDIFRNRVQISCGMYVQLLKMLHPRCCCSSISDCSYLNLSGMKWSPQGSRTRIQCPRMNHQRSKDETSNLQDEPSRLNGEPTWLQAKIPELQGFSLSLSDSSVRLEGSGAPGRASKFPRWTLQLTPGLQGGLQGELLEL